MDQPSIFWPIAGPRPGLTPKEQHHGIVMAIAVEAVVKLVALLAVGAFVVWGVADGVQDVFARIEASPSADWVLKPDRWFGMIAVSGAAVICLPRMFQVMVVEGGEDRSWATGVLITD